LEIIEKLKNTHENIHLAYSTNVHKIFVSSWKDNAFKEAYKYKEKLQIFDGTFYFLQNIENYPPDFEISVNDIIYTRKKTIGINKMLIQKDFSTVIYDVGGIFIIL
jgi:hypothetical protein